jgi:hypothetical protein
MKFNTTFAMAHFLRLCYNVFILENKIEARVFKSIVSICVNLERVLYYVRNFFNLCQFGEGVLLVKAPFFWPLPMCGS